ncbi:MAG TPA: FAD-dependent oxidoreductase [Streptosporangiaceae bacterium]|nr:FAD-dependent oxidoreductase [Streptosporangiaceae bacterium]
MRMIVVGGGVTGAACAYTAASLGAEVVLVDAGLPGQATAAGAGIICPWSSRVDDKAWYAFACAAARDYPALVAELADGPGGEPAGVSYRKVGALMLTRDGDEAARECERLRTGLAATPEMGEVRVVDAAEAMELFPPLRPGSAAVYVGGAARVDGRRLREALIGAARAKGAGVVAGRAALTTRAGRVTGVEVGDQALPGDVVVAAAGAWTASLVAPLGREVRVTPQRGQIVHLSLEPADTTRWPVVLPGWSGHYLLAFDNSRVVAGATRETGSGFDPRVTAGGVHEVLTRALEVAPGLADASHVETRVGLRPAGPDIRPLLGPAGTDGLVVATGLGAVGLTLGPLAGSVAARTALGVAHPFDLTSFDPLR